MGERQCQDRFDDMPVVPAKIQNTDAGKKKTTDQNTLINRLKTDFKTPKLDLFITKHI